MSDLAPFVGGSAPLDSPLSQRNPRYCDSVVGRSILTEAMMQAPAVAYGLSLEPLLGPITLPKAFLDLGSRGWVIVGGESGPGSRPMQPEWARHLRDQCVEAGVPFHFKQWGQHDAQLVQVRRKHDAGRELDGRTWDELPLDRAA